MSKSQYVQEAKRKTFTTDQNNSLKILLSRRMKKGGRKAVNKQRMDSNKVRHHPTTFKRFSSKYEHKEKGLMMKKYKVSC